MSCEECDRIQEKNLKGKNIAFIRIGNAEIMIGACDMHFNELQQKLGITPTGVCRIKDVNKLRG